jgi:hypothetical protein
MTRGFRDPVWGLNVGSSGRRIIDLKGKGRYHDRDVAPTLFSATICRLASHATDGTECPDALID